MNVNISGYFIGPTFSGCQKNSFLYLPKMDMLNIQSEGRLVTFAVPSSTWTRGVGQGGKV